MSGFNLSWLKRILRWAVLGGALFFVGSSLRANWQPSILRLEGDGLACLTIALGVTLFAHIWSGWVWSWMLYEFDQPVETAWAIQTYLKTNIAKYVPGNIWHFYGRIIAVTDAGGSVEAATLSVILEPLLMAAAALLVALVDFIQFDRTSHSTTSALAIAGLLGVLGIIHPRILNSVARRVSQLKHKPRDVQIKDLGHFKVKRYPFIPLLGELGFLGLRNAGFALTFLAITPIQAAQLPAMFSAFSIAWLLGLVVPGAPGGIGVFEATAIALLSPLFTPSIALFGVALYRLVSVLAEILGAGSAWLDSQR